MPPLRQWWFCVAISPKSLIQLRSYFAAPPVILSAYCFSLGKQWQNNIIYLGGYIGSRKLDVKLALSISCLRSVIDYEALLADILCKGRLKRDARKQREVIDFSVIVQIVAALFELLADSSI